MVISEFAKSLRAARLAAKKTLKETAKSASISLTYLSDIEQGRKNTPDLEIVHRFQNFLRADNNHLIILAADERLKSPAEMSRLIQDRPRISDLLWRVRKMSGEELENLINNIPE